MSRESSIVKTGITAWRRGREVRGRREGEGGEEGGRESSEREEGRERRRREGGGYNRMFSDLQFEL